MSLNIEVKSIMSPDIEYGDLPEDIENCSILIELEIGEKNKEGAEIFSFTAVTPNYLVKNPYTHWGRGYLVINSFSWEETESMINKLLSHVKGDTWVEVAENLSKELSWEYENYQEYNS